jgi:hypothetical protein
MGEDQIALLSIQNDPLQDRRNLHGPFVPEEDMPELQE